MNKRNINQYCTYMRKEAAANPFVLGWMALTGGSELTGAALTSILALTALTGAAGGFAASKLTSPGKRDFKNIQREFIRDKLKRTVVGGERAAALETAAEDYKKTLPETKPRSMRI